MICGTPDRTLNLQKLEQEIRAFREEVNSGKTWHFRERYIDRYVLDPYYLLEFRCEVSDCGDDLYDQELFGTPHPALRGVCMTREAKAPGGTYWRPIENRDLIKRLDRFITMYRENYLQPPGYRGALASPEQVHERFEKRRFLFEIRSPRKGIIGVGPKMYAGVSDSGAICGQVADEKGMPLDGAFVELTSGKETLKRTTRDGGLFWFSRLPQGDYRIRIKDRNCIVQVIRRDEFGNAKGWIVDQDGKPVENAELRLKAPDGEVFGAMTDGSGEFDFNPLPAYPVTQPPLDKHPYILEVPDFMFTIGKSVHIKNSVIGGSLKAETGNIPGSLKVILKKDGAEVAVTESDSRGKFIFSGLLGGRYRLEVPGFRIYAREVSESMVTGRVTDISEQVVLELLVKNKTVGIERTTTAGAFSFDNVVPGEYTVRVKKRD